MQKLIDDVMAMLSAPFGGKLDLVHLFLVVGLVIIFGAAWVFILRHIKMAAAELV
jgi:hypothetical protein